MGTRFWLRLLLAPTALAYALLGFVGGLLWLTVTNQPAPLARSGVAGSAVAEIARPLAAPATGRVGFQDAVESVRRLAGQPALLLEGGLQTGPAAGRIGSIYYLESASAGRGDDFFKVDARTGEVIEATFRARLAPAAVPVNLTPNAAEAQAKQFARASFWGFERLTLLDRTVRNGDHGVVYSFRWGQLAADSGAELPVSVTVAVLGQNGQVFWYLGQRDQLQVATTPAVSADDAVATARAWLARRDERWNLDRPTAARLQVLYDDDDRQRLTWSVTFAARHDGPRPSVRVLIDAQTGAIVQG